MYLICLFCVLVGQKVSLGPELAGLLSTTHQNVSLMLQLAPNVTFSPRVQFLQTHGGTWRGNA